MKITYTLLVIVMVVSLCALQASDKNQTGTQTLGSRAFLQYSTVPGNTFQFAKTFMVNCLSTPIGAPLSTVSLGGLVYINGVLYTWNQNAPYELWSIDTASGSHTFVFNMTSVPLTSIMGMCWDGTTVFGASTNTMGSSQLFAVNMANGVCTLIGAPTLQIPSVGGLMCRAGTQSRLYAFSTSDDAIYIWNKTTGVATLVGLLGFNLINVQPSCDPADNSFYLMASNFELNSSQLRTLDTATGGSVVLCTYPVSMRGFAFAPPVLVGIINEGTVPTEYKLSQNYPNPFNPVTNIKFSIKNSGEVKISVYDIQGREVQTLVNERLNPGTYETTFESLMLPSGVYIYKLIAGDFTETKKMTLIK